jgi:class I fructose-bisphosphate aldolase
VAAPGKLLRAPFLYGHRAPLVLAPIDDYLLFGPRNGLEDRTESVDRICGCGADAVLTYAGAIQAYPDVFVGVRTIINLSASTTLGDHVTKRTVHGIETALRLNVAMVASHINLTNPQEGEMLERAAGTIEQANRYEIPTLGIIYPRRPGMDGDDNFEHLERPSDEFSALIAHCAAVGADLGFDLIKTHYTGSIDSFADIVRAAGRTPLVVSGGPITEESRALARAAESYAAGAAGISFGRNLFGRRESARFVEKARNAMSTGASAR